MPDAHRLPRTVEPERYELTLTPDLDAATFAGEERVQVTVHEPVTEVVLNALDLEVHTAELVGDDGARRAGSVVLDPEEQRAVVALDAPAEPGPWTLHLTFSGVLNDKLAGFYRSTYADAEGHERVIATTQFEATDARRAFPCWDEPDFKAVFSVTLVVPEALTAISNGAVVAETDLGNGRRQVDFADTMRMSTYLVAFVVGPLVATAPVDVDGTPLRVYCVPGKEHLTGFALEVGAAALRYFAGYFGIPYPGGKLDLIGLPDFAFGAMENLGAVTFRETALLVDPATASRLELERVADVVAHELAHMWFGDLVTMKWWNGIWLNEAFATFMELLAVDDFRPDWQRWVSFGTSRSVAMGIDGLTATRPIEYPVVCPEESQGMFDVLTYQKGAAVLRMLEQYLGAEPFRSGIDAYLKKHSYANAETTDLWDALEAATGEPVRTTMDSWIFQGGYPVVSVERAEGGVRLSQERFRYLRDGTLDDALWQVPVLLRATAPGGEVQRYRTLLDAHGATVELDGFGGRSGEDGSVVVNEGGSGFYRVRYSGDLLRRLTTNLGSLSALERYNLVSDTWASVVAGLTPLADFADLVRLFGAEDDPTVWSAITGALATLDRLADPGERESVAAFARALVGPAFARVGWEATSGEPDTTGTLRATLLTALGTTGADEEVRRRALELFALAADPAAIDPDLAGPVTAIVARTGGEADYETFLERYRHPSTPQEEVRYLWGLAGFEHRPLVQRTCGFALSNDVRTQNAPYLVGATLGNRVGGDLAWAFTKEHWEEMLRRFPENSIPRMLDAVSALSTPELAADVHAFVAAHPVPGAEKTIQQILERLDVNVALRQRLAGGIAAALGAG